MKKPRIPHSHHGNRVDQIRLKNHHHMNTKSYNTMNTTVTYMSQKQRSGTSKHRTYTSADLFIARTKYQSGKASLRLRNIIYSSNVQISAKGVMQQNCSNY
ncbi:hypothetical protein KIL84_015456 [Mauremys mutica]|uniref:Uncharacterized protein n=1 Tax=Mauremys mutica TaxID=74926 RepID=A0A9D3WMD5_9SAUR|nr:hypothetical protein KIL84_015456 [Mauremys mutica]